MKRLFVLICLCLIILPNSYADSRLTISYINEISDAVKNADQDTLVVFDVDNVISAPSDLIGRRKAWAVRRAIFKEYEQKYGEERVKRIHDLYMMKGNGGLVKSVVKEIIITLQQRKNPKHSTYGNGHRKIWEY